MKNLYIAFQTLAIKVSKLSMIFISKTNIKDIDLANWNMQVESIIKELDSLRNETINYYEGGSKDDDGSKNR